MSLYRVILVVDRAFGERVRDLPESVPAWIVDSATNHPAIVARWERKKEKNHLTGITYFRDFPELSPAELAASMIDTIEEHHGVHSHKPSFSRLTVLGAAADAALTAALEAINFHMISADGSNLEFEKKEETHQAQL